MPLRKLRLLAFPAPSELPDQSSSAESGRSLWRSGLLLATSAAFGGIAVAIWNRRTLAKMRQHSQSPDAE